MLDLLPEDILNKICENLTFTEMMAVRLNKRLHTLVDNSRLCKIANVDNYRDEILPELLKMQARYNLTYNITYKKEEAVNATDMSFIRINDINTKRVLDSALYAESITTTFSDANIDLVNQYTTKKLSIMTSSSLDNSIYPLTVKSNSSLANRVEELHLNAVNINSLAHCKRLKTLKLYGVRHYPSDNTDALLETSLRNLTIKYNYNIDIDTHSVFGAKFDSLVERLEILDITVPFGARTFNLIEAGLSRRVAHHIQLYLSITIFADMADTVFNEPKNYSTISMYLTNLSINSTSNTGNILQSFSCLDCAHSVSTKYIQFNTEQDEFNTYANALSKYLNLESLTLYSVKDVELLPKLPKLKYLAFIPFDDLECSQQYSFSSISTVLEGLKLGGCNNACLRTNIFSGLTLKSLTTHIECIAQTLEDSIVSIEYLDITCSTFADAYNLVNNLHKAKRLKTLFVSVNCNDISHILKISSDTFPESLEYIEFEGGISIEMIDVKLHCLRSLIIYSSSLIVRSISAPCLNHMTLECDSSDSTILDFINYGNINVMSSNVKIKCLNDMLKTCRFTRLSLSIDLTDEMATNIIMYQSKLEYLSIYGDHNRQFAERIRQGAKHIKSVFN